MKLKILDESKIAKLEVNKAVILSKLQMNSDNNNWLKEFYNTDQPFTDSKIAIDDFDLIISGDKLTSSDCDNAKILYDNMKNISESQASDKRLWISLAFGKYYNYMQYRWPIEEGKKGELNLERRWLFPYTNRRSLFVNGIARLWWFAHFTYDERVDNPYELTELLFSRFDAMQRVIYRNYSSSKSVRLAAYKAINQFVQEGRNNSENILDEIYKYISFLGGAYILDNFSEEELQQKIYLKLLQLDDIINKKSFSL